ncbi:hypothetical protein D3C72_1668800 [compost metagenome]
MRGQRNADAKAVSRIARLLRHDRTLSRLHAGEHRFCSLQRRHATIALLFRCLRRLHRAVNRAPYRTRKGDCQAAGFLFKRLIARAFIVPRFDDDAIALQREIFACHQIRTADMELITGRDINIAAR